MEEIDRRVIEIYIDVLANETNFDDLCRELATKNDILTSNLRAKYKQQLERGATNHSLNIELYKDIQTRGKSAFNVLIQCLTKIHPHLVELLLPSKSVAVSVSEEEETSNQNETDCSDYEGVCTVKANETNRLEVIGAVQKLCHSMKARFVSDDKDFIEANFHVAIKADGKFDEKDIKNIEKLYTDHNSNLKIIIINIISSLSEEPDNSTQQPPKIDQGSSDRYNPAAVYIVNIHIHKGDHSPSVINIIKEVVSHNPGYEIRDIFRVVREKLAKWGCRLNTESRNFPKFYF